MTGGDSFTVLHSINRKHAAKQFTLTTDKKTGERRIKNRSYGNESLFRVETVALDGFDDLAAALDRLIGQNFAFPIRGAPVAGTNLNHTPRWKRPRQGQPATFEAGAHHWFCVDLDHIAAPALTDPVTEPEAAIEYLLGLLPPALHDASCWWEFTSSQSLPKADPAAPDTLSARLAFWSEAPLTDAELKRWALAHNTANGGVKIIDPCLYDAIQAHYIAAPSFVGMTDPLPRRHGVRRGLDDTVALVTPPPAAKAPDQIGDQGYEPGQGVAAYLSQIGRPHFREPIVKAIASFVGSYGASTDCTELKADIRKAINRADPGGRSEDELDRYASDEHLDAIIDTIRGYQGNTPGRGFTPDPPPEFDAAPPHPGPGAVPNAPPQPRPVLCAAAGELPAIVDRAEEILIDNDRDLYEFADQIVRPALAPIRIADRKETTGMRLVPVRLHHVIERFTRAVDFQKFSRVRNQWEPSDCPEAVAKAYLERVGAWRLPRLTMITCCPLLLADGRILDRPGFDPASGILFDPQGATFPPVPPRPTRNDAIAALQLFKDAFAEFPFVDDASKSVLWSALLSSVARPAFPFVPLHGFDAPVAGTGKSKLVDCCSVLTKGHECPVISQGDDENEFEKRLGAELVEGNRMISIDNCERSLGGSLLCQIATQSLLKVRLLGFSKTVLVPNGISMFATGNNLKLFGDMLRRGLIGGLDAGVERPELRTFKREDPVSLLKRERGRFVTAALTVLQAHKVAAPNRREQPPLGGFEGWSAVVRDTLLWLGEADPVERIETARTDDPERQKLEAVVRCWQNALGNRSLTARAAIEEACGFDPSPTPSNPNRVTYRHPEFRNALLDVAGERGRVSVVRLGKWLGHNKHKVVDAWRLAADTASAGIARWRLQQLVKGHWE